MTFIDDSSGKEEELLSALAGAKDTVSRLDERAKSSDFSFEPNVHPCIKS